MASGDRNYDIATETTQQEMLSVLNDINTANGNYTNVVYGTFNSSKSSSSSPITYEGNGYISFWSAATNRGQLYLKIDDNDYIGAIPLNNGEGFTIYFNSRVSFYNTQGTGYDISYIVQCK